MIPPLYLLEMQSSKSSNFFLSLCIYQISAATHKVWCSGSDDFCIDEKGPNEMLFGAFESKWKHFWILYPSFWRQHKAPSLKSCWPLWWSSHFVASSSGQPLLWGKLNKEAVNNKVRLDGTFYLTPLRPPWTAWSKESRGLYWSINYLENLTRKQGVYYLQGVP
jgi:hypothetical protein